MSVNNGDDTVTYAYDSSIICKFLGRKRDFKNK